MDPISFTVIVLVSAVTVMYAYFKYSFTYWKSKGVPCDEPSIPFGFLQGVGKTVHVSEIMKRLYDKYKQTGARFCGFYSGPRPSLILLDLDLVKHVYIKDFANFDERNLYYNEKDDPLSANLLTLEGEKWKKLRAKLTPTFSSSKMKLMFPTVVRIADRFRDCLNETIQKETQVEIREFLARYTTDIIGTCAFGIECNSLKDPDAEFRRFGHKAITGFPSVPYLAFLLIFKKLARKLHLVSFPKYITTFFMNVVRDTIDYRKKNHVNRNDFMDILIALKNRKSNNPEETITFNELAAQAFIFFLAGFETTSTALTFSLYELAINPDIQTKARHLIQEVYRKYNGQFTYEMMIELSYVERIIEETLRKYAPTPISNRSTNNNYRIPGTDIIIEKGTTIFIPVHAIHHDPEYYPNPEKFDPDRFSSEEKMKRDPMTFLAFGEGPRNCIGLRFALMQTRVALIILLNNFEFSVGSKTTVPIPINGASFLLSPLGDVYLKVESLNST